MIRRALRRHVGLLLAIAAVGITVCVPTSLWAVNDIPDPGWAITATPTTDLVDGQRIAINVKLRAPLGGAHGVRKNFTGIARSVEGRPAMEVDGEVIELDLARVDRVRLVPVIEF